MRTKDLLIDAIDDVFMKRQAEFNIVSGDVSPEDALKLDEAMEALAMIMNDVLSKQK